VNLALTSQLRLPRRALLALAAAATCLIAHAAPATRDDPLSVRALAAPSQLGNVDAASICSFRAQRGAPLALADVVDRALCNNPQTYAAWANARAQAAQVGIARSAYLPTLTGTAAATRGAGRSTTSATSSSAAFGGISSAGNYTSETGALGATWLLYDFGARAANVESALETLAALNFTQDATVQSVFFKAEQAYYQLFAAQGSVASLVEAERASLEALKAATARLNVGTATPADKLQAQTAYSQAVLNRIQAEGSARNARGVLANVMGLDANVPLDVATPALRQPEGAFEQDVAALLDTARRRRPDLAAAEAQVKAAQSNIDLARAAGLPTISATASYAYTRSSIIDPFHTSAYGVSVSIPIFTGYNRTYQVKAAEAKLEGQVAARDTVNLQVALDVWQAYQAVVTNTQAVRSSADLVAAATESERLALGRYKAGAGTILDVLNAQSALAAARLQNIQALYNWHIAKAALAQALGQLDFGALSALRATP
jgi:TolC family type I secretion outer membrane protein